ncbi:MAG: hypothetical protein SGPRY_007101 [Prymnesium sp.]
MRHAPFGQPPPSDSSESESSEEAESAEEDESEEELLIKTQLLYHTQRPWGWSDMFAALSSATLWVVSSVAFAVANANLFRHYSYSCGTLHSFSSAVAGSLTSLDVVLTGAQFYGSVPVLLLVKASVPCWQMVYSSTLGSEFRKPSIICAVLLISVGMGLAVVGESHISWLTFGLLLSSAALTGLRDHVLHRVLHGHVTGLVWVRGRDVHPIQLIHAMAPWAVGTAVLSTLLFEWGTLGVLDRHVTGTFKDPLAIAIADNIILKFSSLHVSHPISRAI